jgi:hypothetical protein
MNENQPFKKVLISGKIISVLRGRLVVGRGPLEAVAMVRIHPPQPFDSPPLVSRSWPTVIINKISEVNVLSERRESKDRCAHGLRPFDIYY